MDDATQRWAVWQSLLVSYGTVFTRPGWVRFVQWVSGAVPDWNHRKKPPAVLDFRRLLWRRRPAVAQCLLDLEAIKELSPQASSDERATDQVA